uniref:heparosan-N-sulfate-glucuronate 5-epimerase n=1 Tax=Simocephalus serrulatus TaxID=117539 RepID=A0A4Y7NPQ5_9CRUS|nr:EOG090X0272 [Simocephalus serrulatus]SVE94105.1 EOG090X0272 [Simocephalus serrulatus]
MLVLYIAKCGHPSFNQPTFQKPEEPLVLESKGKLYEELDCSINGLYHISCRKEGKEIFIPFSFIEKYYEVYGKLVKYKGHEQFEWSHSYSKVFKPSTRYNSSGMFMYFSNYNVEIRDRVKCVSATEGVPVSTQWEASGYYYPVQVAQYGLSHYSKNLSEPHPRKKILEDGNLITAKWQVPKGAYIRRNYDDSKVTHLLEFNSRDSPGIFLRLKQGTDLVLSIDVRFLTGNSSLTLFLEDRDRSQIFPVSYTCSPVLIEVYNSSGSYSTNYGMGSCQTWNRLTRDLHIDLIKGHVLSGRGKKLSRAKLRIHHLLLKGYGQIDNLTVASSNHMEMFYSSADWLVRHQDSSGGWPIGVKRKIAAGRADLDPGWYSAMGQGQAMSLLMRAFNRSGEHHYLEAALKGMKPFSKSSTEGGVRAYFMNQYPWYEEYPTVPPSFVLNGFIYSLIGLFDVLSLAPRSQVGDAQLLFDQGMYSLKKLLPLFDTGSGTVYDLRHFTLGLAPNIARWDYHSTHINQLLLLSTIDSDSILTTFAERWMSYMQGKRAAHN